MFLKPTGPSVRCGKHQPNKVTVQEENSLDVQGKWLYDRKQSGYGGHTKLVFWKKAKTTKKIVLRFECIKPNYRSKGMLAAKRCKHIEMGRDTRKGQVIQL
ncbi:PREDICTED: 60S ribosomal protein L36a-like [Propithecus coquereli]|uniref:60S ribosomal protein L36a-like n=1 Tax=Propithecus coquereli TaxID=379532 RepID=UPI00063F932E|nr:PREDICTED: 60S ribosomal protein L36a-like [Propithecus coquereli]